MLSSVKSLASMKAEVARLMGGGPDIADVPDRMDIPEELEWRQEQPEAISEECEANKA